MAGKEKLEHVATASGGMPTGTSPETLDAMGPYVEQWLAKQGALPKDLTMSFLSTLRDARRGKKWPGPFPWMSKDANMGNVAYAKVLGELVDPSLYGGQRGGIPNEQYVAMEAMRQGRVPYDEYAAEAIPLDLGGLPQNITDRATKR